MPAAKAKMTSNANRAVIPAPHIPALPLPHAGEPRSASHNVKMHDLRSTERLLGATPSSDLH